MEVSSDNLHNTHLWKHCHYICHIEHNISLYPASSLEREKTRCTTGRHFPHIILSMHVSLLMWSHAPVSPSVHLKQFSCKRIFFFFFFISLIRAVCQVAAARTTDWAPELCPHIYSHLFGVSVVGGPHLCSLWTLCPTPSIYAPAPAPSKLTTGHSSVDGLWTPGSARCTVRAGYRSLHFASRWITERQFLWVK